jgi:predicted ABC-class ATPase
VDLRPFIHDLPLGRPTAPFDTEDASGSTSQAAAIIEALEAGARVLLIDEDTAATNFMIRDARMRRLVPAEREPITPFLDRVRQVYDTLGVSSVLIVGGAGDYLDVADRVILMDSYRPNDATQAARDIARDLPMDPEAMPAPPAPWPEMVPRTPLPASFDPSRGRRAERVRSRSTRAIEFGAEEIDVSLVAQLVDPAQCRLIGDLLLALSRGLCDGRVSLAAILERIEEGIAARGVEGVAEPTFGDRAWVRRHELAAAINRLRSLRIAATGGSET